MGRIRMCGFLLITCAAALAATPTGGAAYAQEHETKDTDAPEEYGATDLRHLPARWMHHYDEDTRNCIGNPSTPVCATETWIICKDLRSPEICAKVGFRVFPTDTRPPSPAEAYRLHSLKRAGEFIEVVYELAYCEENPTDDAGDGDCDDSIYGPLSVYLKRKNDAWHVHSWTDQNDGFECFEFPPSRDSFLSRKCALYGAPPPFDKFDDSFFVDENPFQSD